jgi:predicted small secreted protein
MNNIKLKKHYTVIFHVIYTLSQHSNMIREYLTSSHSNSLRLNVNFFYTEPEVSDDKARTQRHYTTGRSRIANGVDQLYTVYCGSV